MFVFYTLLLYIEVLHLLVELNGAIRQCTDGIGTLNKTGRKKASPSEGEAEGGCGGPEAEQVRYGVKISPRTSRCPAVAG